jgi:D-alanyl-lipoteichoic acid acyltransferase DltB (MBOAT superfamily)
MMTIGAWHSLSFNWLLWGALHATGLVCVMEWQRWCRRAKLAHHFSGAQGYVLGMLLTFLYVSWVFAFVSIDSPVAALRAFGYALTGQVLL